MKSLIKKSLLLTVFVLITIFVFIPGCQQPGPAVTLKPILDKYADAWNTGNLDELDSIVDSNFVRHFNLDPEINGIDSLKKQITMFRTAYPDLKITVDDGVYSENKAAGRWSLTAANTGQGMMPPTGKSVKTWGESIFHFVNGKITEEWAVDDDKSFMEQLGFTMMPPSNNKMQKMN